LRIRSYIHGIRKLSQTKSIKSLSMRMKIYTKRKRTAKELSQVNITVSKAECFNGHVPHYAVSTLFNSRGAVNRFDKDINSITHPTKGKLYKLPANVMKFVSIV